MGTGHRATNLLSIFTKEKTCFQIQKQRLQKIQKERTFGVEQEEVSGEQRRKSKNV
jgi:hypothetical protein